MKAHFAATLVAFSSFIANAGEQRPNILWIITDDQRFDSIAAFNRIRRDGKADSPLGAVLSPNVDRLAAMGTTFINNFNHNPSCQPSRTIMHTGRYSHRTGVYGFEYHNPSGMEHWKPMVPEVLRDQAGYQTLTVGKLGLYAQHFANKKNPRPVSWTGMPKRSGSKGRRVRRSSRSILPMARS
jgi:arylsulfatase A-like enzyme